MHLKFTLKTTVKMVSKEMCLLQILEDKKLESFEKDESEEIDTLSDIGDTQYSLVKIAH